LPECDKHAQRSQPIDRARMILVSSCEVSGFTC